jgi:hypothetical protein
MLQGDALAVQLFIGAAALTALSVAMTQAGWTHRWFVGSMFALAAILTACSAGWEWVEPRIPFVAGTLSAIAASRIAWFLAGMALAFTIGLKVDDVLRAKRARKTTRPTEEALYKLHQLIEEMKEKLESDQALYAAESENKVGFSTFHEVTAVILLLVKIGIPTPFVPKSSPDGDLVQYETFNQLMYRYFSVISPYLREGNFELTCQWARIFLEREREKKKSPREADDS